MPDMTTIKVSRATRDRLKAQAAAAHLTLGAHLDRLAAEGERRARFEAVREAARRSPADADEVEAWDRTEWHDA